MSTRGAKILSRSIREPQLHPLWEAEEAGITKNQRQRACCGVQGWEKGGDLQALMAGGGSTPSLTAVRSSPPSQPCLSQLSCAFSRSFSWVFSFRKEQRRQLCTSGISGHQREPKQVSLLVVMATNTAEVPKMPCR